MIGLKSARHLADLFWPAFEERDGAVVFVGREYPQLGEFKTRTAAEAFYSHTHLLDEFRHSISWGPDPVWPDAQAPDSDHPEFAVACDLARTIAQMWLRKLEGDFPGDRFRVYVTTRNDPIVRFHRVYEGEVPWASDEQAAEQIASGDVTIYASADRDRPSPV